MGHERDAEELRVLLDISQSLHQYIRLDDLLSFTIAKTKEAMNAGTVAILLYDAATDELFFRSTHGNPEEGEAKLKDMRFSARLGIAGSVLKNRKPELILDVSKDPRHLKSVDENTGFSTESMIVAPLYTRDKSIGVIEVCNKKGGKFSSRDVDLLSTIAGTIAMALDNSRMYAELDAAYRELQLTDRAKTELLETTKAENIWLRREVEGRFHFQNIIGNCQKMTELFSLCEKAINSDVTVLIEGETGTGKELIAKCLHFNGPRKEKRFVTQNCGGIPDSLLASELFGYKKGAFTGAVADKKGLFEVANAGTLLLDEVGEMSPVMQVSLLRVVQEGEIKPLGSNETRKIDVRLISATNRDLLEDVRQGLFREDLYYRLNVFAIRSPALRERSTDIPILANHFLQKFNKKHNRSLRGLSPDAMEALSAYPFPGNVRELENEIERAVLMTEDGGRIETCHLSGKILPKPESPLYSAETRGQLKDAVEALEKKSLSDTLRRLGGNKTKAAMELGLSRFGLIKKLKRYGL